VEIIRALEAEIAQQEKIIASYRRSCEAAGVQPGDPAPVRSNAEYADLQRELLQQREGAQRMEQEWSATVQQLRDELDRVLEERATLDGFLRDLSVVLFRTEDYSLNQIISRVSQLVSTSVAPPAARPPERSTPVARDSPAGGDEVIIYQLERATDEITSLRATIAGQEAEIGRLRGLVAAQGGTPAAAPTQPSRDAGIAEELEHFKEQCAQLEEARAADRQRLRLLEREHLRKVESLEKQWEESQAMTRDSYERRLEGAAARLRAAELSGELLQKEKLELELALNKLRQQKEGENRLEVEKRLQSLENQGESLLVKDATEKLAMTRQELERERREFQKALLDRKIELGGYREELTDILNELSHVLGQ